MTDMRLGVLALQGAFREHRRAFERLGATVTEVRLPKHLHELQGIVVPGGESTTMARLMAAYGLDKALLDFYREGGAIWGTCAGAIAVSSEIIGHPGQLHLDLMDISVQRNWYGRQVSSFEADVDIKGLARPFHAIFIRAPRIARTGSDVDVLATYDGDPIMARAERLMATVFHPELADDDRVHQFFVEDVVER